MFPETIELIIMQHQTDRACREYKNRYVPPDMDNYDEEENEDVEPGKYVLETCCPIFQALKDAAIDVIRVGAVRIEHEDTIGFPICAVVRGGKDQALYEMDQAAYGLVEEFDETVQHGEHLYIKPAVVKLTRNTDYEKWRNEIGDYYVS